LRRYIPTLIVLVILLALGGFAIYSQFSPTGLFSGYIPTLNPDAQVGQTQALMLVGGIVGGLVVLFGLGAALAFAFYQLPRLQARMAAPPAPPRAEAPARPAAKGKGETQPEPVPLSDTRSLIIFWAVVLVLLAAFLFLSYAGAAASPLPSLDTTVFKLPGQHIKGLPSFVAGPGDEVKAWQLFIAILGGAIVGTGVVGIVLARGFDILDRQMKALDKAPRTFVDRMLVAVEARIRGLRAPRAPRPRVNALDRLFMLLNGALFLVVLAVVAAYVVPSFSTTATVNNAIRATETAALWTPTAPPTAAPAPIEVLQAELAALPKGDPQAGQTEFTAAGCAACHSLQPNVRIVGPSQVGIATRAATRKPGYSAELYIYESITRPNAYVVEGFPSDVMPKTFKDTLKPQQVADLIAFLMTLK
jgi:cytochrome c2